MRALSRSGLVAVLIGITIAGCSSDSRTGPGPTEPSVEVELTQLRQRIADLKVAVEVAGRMTPALQAELNSIQEGVTRWQKRSGREDLSFTRATSRQEGLAASPPVSAVQRGDPGTGACATCPTIKTMAGGYVCFLTYMSDCRPGELITRVCTYVCFRDTGIIGG